MIRAHVWITEPELAKRNERARERRYNCRLYCNDAGDYVQWRDVPSLPVLMANFLTEVTMLSIPITTEEISREPPTEDYKHRMYERDRPITEDEIRPFL